MRISIEQVKKRPTPFRGMLVWSTQSLGWQKHQFPHDLAKMWEKGASGGYLLPGEPECPPVPRQFHVIPEEAYVVLDKDRWDLRIRTGVNGHEYYKRCLPVPSDYKLLPVSDVVVSNLSEDQIKCRPYPFIGMPYCERVGTPDPLWSKFNNQAQCDAAAEYWAQGREWGAYLRLPGEPGCPDLPMEMRHTGDPNITYMTHFRDGWALRATAWSSSHLTAKDFPKQIPVPAGYRLRLVSELEYKGISPEQVKARPMPFVGMAYYGNDDLWYTIDRESTCSSMARSWAEGISLGVLLPGEPDCPAPPRHLWPKLGDYCLRRDDTGLWWRVRCIENDLCIAVAIPLGHEYKPAGNVVPPTEEETPTESGILDKKTKTIAGEDYLLQNLVENKKFCPACITALGRMPLSPGTKGWHCEACGYPKRKDKIFDVQESEPFDPTSPDRFWLSGKQWVNEALADVKGLIASITLAATSVEDDQIALMLHENQAALKETLKEIQRRAEMPEHLRDS